VAEGVRLVLVLKVEFFDFSEPASSDSFVPQAGLGRTARRQSARADRGTASASARNQALVRAPLAEARRGRSSSATCSGSPRSLHTHPSWAPEIARTTQFPVKVSQFAMRFAFFEVVLRLPPYTPALFLARCAATFLAYPAQNLIGAWIDRWVSMSAVSLLHPRPRLGAEDDHLLTQNQADTPRTAVGAETLVRNDGVWPHSCSLPRSRLKSRASLEA
jgi:hypothetical protein